MKTEKSAVVTFRLSDSLKKELERIAEDETRSLSQQVEHFVKLGIKIYKGKHHAFQKE